VNFFERLSGATWLIAGGGELQEFSRSQARKLGIEESDVERLVAEYRAEH
jgi:hypothetical protein